MELLIRPVKKHKIDFVMIDIRETVHMAIIYVKKIEEVEAFDIYDRFELSLDDRSGILYVRSMPGYVKENHIAYINTHFDLFAYRIRIANQDILNICYNHIHHSDTEYTYINMHKHEYAILEIWSVTFYDVSEYITYRILAKPIYPNLIRFRIEREPEIFGIEYKSAVTLRNFNYRLIIERHYRCDRYQKKEPRAYLLSRLLEEGGKNKNEDEI